MHSNNRRSLNNINSGTSLVGKPLHLQCRGPSLTLGMRTTFHHCYHSVAQSCLTLCDSMTAARQVCLSSTTSQNLFQFASILSVMLSNHLILCRRLLLPPSIFPSISVFSKASAPVIRWSKYHSFSNSPFNEYSRLISFRIYWSDFLAVQGTLVLFPYATTKDTTCHKEDPVYPKTQFSHTNK